MSDEIATLNREPDVSCMIEYQRMRITRRWIRHRNLLDLTGFRVQSPDVGLSIAGVPDNPVGVDDQVVRPGAFGEVISPKLAGHDIQGCNIVSALPHEPYGAVCIDIRISRARGLPGYVPFMNDDDGVVDSHVRT